MIYDGASAWEVLEIDAVIKVLLEKAFYQWVVCEC